MVGTTYFWQGSANASPNDGDNWLDPLGPSTGTAPADGDSIVFDSTSDGNNDCQFDSANFPASGELVDVTISANFTKFLTTSTTTSINLDGKLEINVGEKIKPTHSMTFDFNTAGTTTVYDGNGDSYTHKPLVIYNVADSMFSNESARALVTFNFNALNLSLIDGIYPNITFTGTIYAKSIYSNNSRSLHNTYGSVDILDFNGGSIDSTLYNIYDYDKQFLFEKGFTSIGQFFRFGHTTARFKTYRSSGTGSVIFPANGELNSAAFGNDTNNNFYTQYNKIIIENNDSASNYWLLRETIECNELIINDGGRFYGPSDGSRAAAIRCVKRPTLKGDWNYRQITDGIYESIGDSSNVSVYHGGTGRQTLTNNNILYGQGMDQVGLDTDFAYDPVEKFLEVEKVKSHIVIQVKNETGSTIPKGAAVYVDDNGTTPLVALACGDTASKMPAIGLIMEQIADGASGYAAVNGIITISSSQIEDTLSDPADIGKILYVSSTNPGKLTINKPEYPNHLIQNIGNIATISGGNVKVTISNIGRTNDTPNTALHPCFFERAALDTTAVDFRVPTVQSSTANPNGYPMPFAGTVRAASFLFAGSAISTTGNTNTIRIRKNGGTSGSDIKEFTFTESDLVNTNGFQYTLVKSGSDVLFTFAAGDVLQVRRQSGSTDLNNGQAILWVKFNNG